MAVSGRGSREGRSNPAGLPLPAQVPAQLCKKCRAWRSLRSVWNVNISQEKEGGAHNGVFGDKIPQGPPLGLSQPQVAGASGIQQAELEGKGSWDGSIFPEPPPAAAQGQSLWSSEDFGGNVLQEPAGQQKARALCYPEQQWQANTEHLQCD